MANITFLSWNIQNYGPSKYYTWQQSTITVNGKQRKIRTRTAPHKNRNQLISLICKTAEQHNASVFSVLEIAKSTSVNICNDIVSGLNTVYRSTNKSTSNDWTYSILGWTEPRYESEVYALFWRTGLGITKVNDPNVSTDILRGLTNTDAAGTALKFQRGKTSSGSNGRPPGYFAFTYGTNKYLTILCYHAMFNSSARDYWGVNSYPEVGPVTQISSGGTKTVDAALLSGDLNVDLLTATSEYANFATQSCTLAIASTVGNPAKSTVVNTTPSGGYTSSVDYRVNAYDNIACKGTTAIASSKVIDMIDLLKTKTNNPYDTITSSFVKGAITPPVSNVFQLPPADYEDSWELYRYAISDHLPVITTATI